MIEGPGTPVLRAAVVSGIVVVMGVEVASALSLLSVATGAFLALVATLVGIAVAMPAVRSIANLRPGVEEAIVALVIVVTLVIGLVAAPNTWDSMTYHLPRVDHWLTRGSVDHYPTSIDRQIWQPPFGEYLLLVARSLGGGGDRLANGVQWLASLGCAAAAGRIAALLGASQRTVWLAAVLALTAPPVLLQATSTQNDLVAGFWIATAAAFAIESTTRSTRTDWLWIGAALALAIGTKGTALVFGLPWILLAIAGGRGRGLMVGLRGVVMAAAVVGAINLPWMLRNTTTYGNPLGDPVVQRLLRPVSMVPPVFASNLVANASIHWALPGEPARRAAESLLDAVHRALGVDPGALYPYFGGLRIEPWSTDEDLAGNPLLFLAGLVAGGLALRRWRALGQLERGALAAVLGGMLLFGLVVRWQPFNGRLQLPGAVLAIPIIAVAFGRLGSRMARALAIVAGVTGLPPLLTNTIRPVLGPRFQLTRGAPPVGSIFDTPRAEQYYARQPGEGPAYRRVVERLISSRCDAIGVRAGYDSWEYPLWLEARAAGAQLRFEHVQVVNPTGRSPGPTKPPCGLVAIDQRPDWSPDGPFKGWTVVERAGRLSLWWPGRRPP